MLRRGYPDPIDRGLCELVSSQRLTRLVECATQPSCGSFSPHAGVSECRCILLPPSGCFCAAPEGKTVRVEMREQTQMPPHKQQTASNTGASNKQQAHTSKPFEKNNLGGNKPPERRLRQRRARTQAREGGKPRASKPTREQAACVRTHTHTHTARKREGWRSDNKQASKRLGYPLGQIRHAHTETCAC